MINTWFTSDTHFGHKNILQYEKEARPFSSVEEMNEVLIERWNSVVRNKDTVYHLGDFCFGRQNLAIAERLNGKKHLVLGNHDTYPAADYLKYFSRVFGGIFWKSCLLTHFPVHPNQLGSRCALNVHGHLHSKRVWDVDPKKCLYEDRNYFNVSCEQNNLTPFHADQILLRVKEIS